MSLGWYAHLGVLTALVELDLIPSKVCGKLYGPKLAFFHKSQVVELICVSYTGFVVAGSSAGALVSSAFASGMTVQEIREIFFRLKRTDIMLTWVEAGRPMMGIFAPNPSSPLIDALGVKRLEDCVMPVCVSAFELGTLRTRVFTSGNIQEVVSASCSVPGLVEPAWVNFDGDDDENNASIQTMVVGCSMTVVSATLGVLQG